MLRALGAQLDEAAYDDDAANNNEPTERSRTIDFAPPKFLLFAAWLARCRPSSALLARKFGLLGRKLIDLHLLSMHAILGPPLLMEAASDDHSDPLDGDDDVDVSALAAAAAAAAGDDTASCWQRQQQQSSRLERERQTSCNRNDRLAEGSVR